MTSRSAASSRAASRAVMLRELRGHANPTDAAFLQRYFKTGPGEYGEGDRFLGIRVPVLRRLAGRYRHSARSQVEALLQSPYHEARLLALLIMVQQFRRGDAITQRAVYRSYRAHLRWINNWDLVDVSAEHVVGGYLWTRSRRPLDTLARSPSLWRRRVAVMATLYFIRREDYGDTLRLARALLQDREDLIHKAVGWMLREVGNRDRATEEAFLRRHYRNMPRTMLRYAIERFPPRLRARYLAGTV